LSLPSPCSRPSGPSRRRSSRRYVIVHAAVVGLIGTWFVGLAVGGPARPP